MVRALRDAPLIVLLLGIGAVAMLVPAGHAYGVRAYPIARAFLYGGLLTGAVALLLGLAAGGNPRDTSDGRVRRRHLVTMIATFSVLPLALAVPFYEAVPDTGMFRSWWEMVSAITTTGATLYEPARLAPSLHLWRAMVGWMGGFFVLVMAIAVLAPMRLGGFEIFGTGGGGGPRSAPGNDGVRGGIGRARGGEAPTFFAEDAADPDQRIRHYARVLLPVYVGLTAVLWIALMIAGEDGLVAMCIAMSTLATSSVLPSPDLGSGQSGFAGEVLIFVFLIPALSRRFWPGGGELRASSRLIDDPELRLAAVLVLGVTGVMFLRHWIAAFEIDIPLEPMTVLASIWGGLFTSLSFLTSAGFESASWDNARNWSGLGTPGLILAGFAITGGGIATTAGGVRLLRVYALMRHGEQELIGLVHPTAVSGGGATARWLRRQGAYIAWVFFMLFAFSIAAVMMAVTLTGVPFETATVTTIAALSNTGPLATIAGDVPIRWENLGVAAQTVLALAMVVGRVETLAIIALLNPDFWRR